MKKFAKGYEIDWAANTVIVTKEFSQKANDFESNEFDTMQELRKLGLKVSIRKIAERKPAKREAGAAKPFGRPTYRQMMIHINNSDDALTRLPEFEKVKNEALAHGNAYQYVLDWFKSVYPNFRAVPTFTAKLEIVNDPNDENEAA